MASKKRNGTLKLDRSAQHGYRRSTGQDCIAPHRCSVRGVSHEVVAGQRATQEIHGIRGSVSGHRHQPFRPFWPTISMSRCITRQIFDMARSGRKPVCSHPARCYYPGSFHQHTRSQQKNHVHYIASTTANKPHHWNGSTPIPSIASGAIHLVQ